MGGPGVRRPWGRLLPLTSLLQGFQVAYVVFQKPGGMSAALALKGPLLVSTESHPVSSGVLSQYRGPGWGGQLWGPRLLVLPGPQGVHPGGLGEEIPPRCRSWGAPERQA